MQNSSSEIKALPNRPVAGSLLMLGSALAFAGVGALAQVGIRRMSTTEPAVRIVFYFTLISTIVSAIPLTWSWQAAPLRIWLSLLGIGLVAVFGQMMMTTGYRPLHPGPNYLGAPRIRSIRKGRP